MLLRLKLKKYCSSKDERKEKTDFANTHEGATGQSLLAHGEGSEEEVGADSKVAAGSGNQTDHQCTEQGRKEGRRKEGTGGRERSSGF